MFNTLGIEAVICTVEKGSFKFQDIFFKTLRLSEFLIDLSRLFYSIIAEGKIEFLKKLCLK